MTLSAKQVAWTVRQLGVIERTHRAQASELQHVSGRKGDAAQHAAEANTARSVITALREQQAVPA